MVVLKFKATPNSFRRLEDPTLPESSKYFFYVKVDDIVEGIPMATNPRDQKLSSNVAAAIRDSLESNDGYFHKKNRGITLSAESCMYNNKTHIVTIVFQMIQNMVISMEGIHTKLLVSIKVKA